MSDRPRRSLSVSGGFEAANQRQMELAERVTPHTPSAFPTPGAAHYRGVATSKRREIDSLKAQRIADRVWSQREIQRLQVEANQYDKLAKEAQP